jgi:hypothetical protein
MQKWKTPKPVTPTPAERIARCETSDWPHRNLLDFIGFYRLLLFGV